MTSGWFYICGLVAIILGGINMITGDVAMSTNWYLLGFFFIYLGDRE